MKKRIFRLFLAVTTVLVLFAGCGLNNFDEELLIGTWDASDGYRYTFMEDYSGVSTDSGGRGLNFSWSLSGDELQMRFTGSGQAGKSAYLTYVIESLTESKLEAYDKNDPDEEIVTFRKR